MKKLFICVFLLHIQLYGAVPVPCSLVIESGSSSAFEDLEDFLKEKNDKINDYWKNDIKPIINKIKEESSQREEKLKKLREIEKERLVTNKQIEFLVQQEAELLSNKANIESEIKE